MTSMQTRNSLNFSSSPHKRCVIKQLKTTQMLSNEDLRTYMTSNTSNYRLTTRIFYFSLRTWPDFCPQKLKTVEHCNLWVFSRTCTPSHVRIGIFISADVRWIKVQFLLNFTIDKILTRPKSRQKMHSCQLFFCQNLSQLIPNFQLIVMCYCWVMLHFMIFIVGTWDRHHRYDNQFFSKIFCIMSCSFRL